MGTAQQLRLQPFVFLLLATVASVVLLTPSPVAAADRCEILKSKTTCDGVLDYSSVFLSGTTCQDQVEALATRVQGILPILSKTCRDQFARYSCSKLYPRCSVSSPGGVASGVSVCDSLCQSVITGCSLFEKAVVLGNIQWNFPGECSGLPTSGCYTGVNATFTQSTAYAQCQTYNPTGMCAEVVSYPVIVPAHGSQAELEAQLTPSKPVLWIAPLTGSGGGEGCLKSLMRYLCARAFLPCDTEVLLRGLGIGGLPSPFPQLPCQSVCNNFERECYDFLRSNPALSALIPQCNTTGTYQQPVTVCGVPQDTGGPDFPVNRTVWAIVPPASVLSSPCNKANASLGGEGGTAPNVQCPYPLVIPDAHAVASGFVNPIGGACAMPCPLPLLTASEYDWMGTATIAVMWTSIITNGKQLLLLPSL